MGSCHSSIGKKTRGDGLKTDSPKRHRLFANGSGRWKKKRDEKNRTDDNAVNSIEGKMFANGSSKIACLYTQQGRKGVNQDSMLVWENFYSRNDTVFCGVFDGHGPFGHMVSKKVRDMLPLILSTQWKVTLGADQINSENAPGSKCIDDTESVSIDGEWYESPAVEEKEKLPEMYLPLKQSILKAFKLMDKELKLHPTIDCFCSGTTGVTLVKQGKDLVLGNVGDSRAVLAMRDEDNSLVPVQLTVDLKPDLPREAARIQQCKGRVFALQDEPEVARVWLPNNDSPGLAMARAFGDFCLKDFGLISVPDVYYRCLSERDEFIILATDGVWDVLSNKEAVDVVASAPSEATAARALVDCAVRAWKLKYPTSKNDDCAVVCLFLKHVEEYATPTVYHEASENLETSNHQTDRSEDTDDKAQVSSSLDHSVHSQGSDEIVSLDDESVDRTNSRTSEVESKRSLAECISVADDDDEWSALEGITRVNSLVEIPRFLSWGDKSSITWRKWL